MNNFEQQQDTKTYHMGRRRFAALLLVLAIGVGATAADKDTNPKNSNNKVCAKTKTIPQDRTGLPDTLQTADFGGGKYSFDMPSIDQNPEVTTQPSDTITHDRFTNFGWEHSPLIPTVQVETVVDCKK